jgi:menaquinone-9 beta-reductase
MLDADVLICGGGPAGLAAAIAATQQGYTVLVADCLKPPIDKACGEGLMPDALAALAELGVTLEAADTGAFRGVRFVEGKRSVEAGFPNGAARGIRRTHLHELLHRRAQQLGVHFLWGTQILNVAEVPAKLYGTGHILAQAGREQIRARWAIGADGMNSRVRRWAGLDRGRRTSARIGLRRHYKIRPWSQFMEVHWAASGQAYVTPVGAEEVCVVAVARDRYESVESALPLFPELASHLRNALCVGSKRGALTAGQIYNRVVTERIALVGDASGSVDAIAGAGLGLAFLQAAALGPALAAGDLSLYQQAHREIRRRPAFLSQSLLLMDRYAAIRGMSLASFQRKPQLLERMLALHVGAVPLTVWGRNGVANLGLELLCG